MQYCSNLQVVGQMHHLDEEFECPVCTELCARPRECVACGRLFCASCIAHLKSCSICRKEPFASRKNRFAARVLNNLQVKCAQCAAQIQRSRLEDHKKTCAARVRACSFKSCDFVAKNFEEAADHLKAEHLDEIWENFEDLSKLEVSSMSTQYLNLHSNYRDYDQ